MTEACFTIVYTILWVGFSAIVLSVYSAYQTKKREEEEARRTRARQYLERWYDFGTNVSASLPWISRDVANIKYNEVRITVVKSRRQLIVLRNTCKSPDMFGLSGYKDTLVIHVVEIPCAELVMCDNFYILRLPIGYTGKVSISDDYNIDHVIKSAKRCFSVGAVYDDDCKRVELMK